MPSGLPLPTPFAWPVCRSGSVRLRTLAVGLALGLSAACASLPSTGGRTVSFALTDTAETILGRAVQPLAAAHPDRSGIVVLPEAIEAFEARVVLARLAQRSLDVQYYIWRKDRSGVLLFHELVRAAERGVRVRLLLDDHQTAGLGSLLAALDAHPQIEVRLFNPVPGRGSRVVYYLTDFGRLNRRMHNKSFTADSQATIVGGRNIGDEYFGATTGMIFEDLDVLAVGPAALDVARDFDRYWSSPSAYPADRLLPPAGVGRIERLARSAARVLEEPAAAAYREVLRSPPLLDELTEGSPTMEWASTVMVSDDPAKGLGQAPPEGLLLHQLVEIIGEPSTSLELVSPYFVPTAHGVVSLVSLAERGVRVRVLTNSLQTTDSILVHAGYSKWRKPLLEGGVVLYELRGSRDAASRRSSAGLGSGGAALHAKTFAADGRVLFVGSFNFDPRSARLNTEMGFVIASPSLAHRVASEFDIQIPGAAYEVRLSPDGGLRWIERSDGREVVHRREPGTGFWRRAWMGFLSLLPIEKHL